MNDEENARYVAAVEKRSGAPPGDGGSGAVGENEPATIDDFDDRRDTRVPGEPQPQVATETEERMET